MSAKRFKYEFQDEGQTAEEGAAPRRGSHAAPGDSAASITSHGAHSAGRHAGVAPSHATGATGAGRQSVPRFSSAPSSQGASQGGARAAGQASGRHAGAARFSAPSSEGHVGSAPSSHVDREGVAQPRVGRHSAGARFASATRATSGAHRFASLGGTTDLGLAAGEVPVTSTTGDVPGGAFSTDEAPRPIGVDPSVTGSFHTISANQGAVISTRETAAHAAEVAREALPDAEDLRVPEESRAAARMAVKRSSKAASRAARRQGGRVPGVIIAAAVGIVAVLLVVVVAIRLTVGAPVGAPSDDAVTDGQLAQTNVAADGSVKLGDYTYELTQANGAWSFVRVSGGETLELAKLTGTPVSIALYNGVFYVAENLSDGSWDIISYMAADGSVASQFVGGDDQPITGQGTLVSSVVDGSSLVLTDDSGSKTAIPLS